MRAELRNDLRSRRSAEWRDYVARLAAYTPLPAERTDTPDPRIVLWAFAKRALIIEPPEIAAPLGPWAALWYAARRDANLLLRCPICDASGLVTDMRPARMVGRMEHEAACPVSDAVARRLRAEPFPERAA
jgi:hypothetical protein